MGHTYKKQRAKFDDEFTQKRKGKSPKHAIGHKTGGLKTLNSISEDYYEKSIDLNDNTNDIQIIH